MDNKEVINEAVAVCVRSLKQLRAEKDKIEKAIEIEENIIKNIMESENQYEFAGEDWKVTWNMVASNRFNQSLFKESHPDLFKEYVRLSEGRRFIIS